MTDDRLQVLQKARQILGDQRLAIAHEIAKTGSAGPAEWDSLHKLDLALQSLDDAIDAEEEKSLREDPIYGIDTA